MSSASERSAAIAGAMRPYRLTVAERNFWKAALLTVACIAFFHSIYFVERNVFQHHPRAARFVGESTEAAMRYITLPHIIIGFLFLVTSRNNQTLRKRAWMFALLLVGAALCALYGWSGGKTNVLFYTSIYLYFLVHELRDEAMFYVALGDAPPIADRAAFQRMVRAMIALTIAAVVAIAWIGVPFGLVPHGRGFIDPSRPLALKVALSIAPLVLWGLATHATVAYFARGLRGGVRELLHLHAPLFRLMAGSAAVLGLSLLLTQRAYSLIVFHVAAWYVFASYQFSRNRPSSTPRGWWTWMRTDRNGFRFLHIGMVVLLMAIGLVWVFGFGKPPVLNWLLAEESFLYWTIMHITVSFVPR